ncbi:tail fiber domain-containing protein [Providencia hangzhouensis]|uniref:tail fiber/spike domain-containing protein n=1 Tax=Providencia hangzhouensis TaxID=3031799 RepID=UPI0034DD4D73
MTVSTEISSNEYTGNGVTTDFDYKFRIFKENQLSVITSDADGDNVLTLRLGTDYTVTGANKSAGGKVILNKPLANGHKVSIARDIPITQETSFRNQSKFFAETHEDAFDYLTMIIQRIWGSLGSLYLKRPNILANWFDAKGYRIANLGKPKRDSDAVDLGTLKDEISGVNSTILKREKRLLRVDDMDIAALPKAQDRRNKQIGFNGAGLPELLDPVDTGALGYILVDSFEQGFTLTGRFQALFWVANREYFRWDGPMPKIVPPNSTPHETGGVKSESNPDGLWVSINDASWRGNLSGYTNLTYKHSNSKSAIYNMVSGFPVASKIGDIVSTGGTIWLREKNNGLLSDFRPLSVIDISDWGALGIADDAAALQAGIDYADSISHPCTAPTSAKFKISKSLTFKNSGFALSQINLVAMSGFDGDAMIVSEYSGTGNSRTNVRLNQITLDCASSADIGFKFSGIGQGSYFNNITVNECITGGVFVGSWAFQVWKLRVRGKGKELLGAGLSLGVPGSAKPGFSNTNQVNNAIISECGIFNVYDGVRLHYGAANKIHYNDIEFCNVGVDVRYANSLSIKDNYIESCEIASWQLGSTSTTTLPENCVIRDNYFNMCGDAKFKSGSNCTIGQNQYRSSKVSLNTTSGSTSTGNLFIINRGDIQPQTGDLDMSKNRLMTNSGEFFRAGINSNVGQHVDNGATYVFDSYGNVRCRQLFKLDGEDCISVGLLSNTNPDYYAQATKGNIRLGGVSSVKPIFDNANSLGEPSQRWKDGYFVNAPTASSDKNLKTTPEPIPEAMLSPLLEVIDNIVLWKWISSVNEKGDNARKHAGIIAQDVYAIFARHNIDAFEYGFIGRDKTDDGEIWSVRASELQWLCLWALRNQYKSK